MEPAQSSVIKVASIVTFYFIVSITLVFANKFVLNTFDFPFPLFMTWAQLLVAEVFILVGGLLSHRLHFLVIFAPLELDWNIAKNVLPLTFVYIGMVTFNNVCLQYVEVTFYQVARSLTIVWTIFFTYINFPDKPIPPKVIVACLVVFSGFIIGSVGEVNFDWKGLIAGVISSAFVAYYGIAIKKALTLVNNNEWRLLLYNTTLAIILFIPLLLLTGEFLILFPDPQHPFTRNVWTGLLISGVLGYLINIAIFMQVNYTSPLTNAISGTAKACVQTLAGWLLFRNPISTMNGIGIVTVIGGSTWYSYVRPQANTEDKLKQKQKEEQENTDDVENPVPNEDAKKEKT